MTEISEQFRPRKVFYIGNGAVENGWQTVKSVFAKNKNNIRGGVCSSDVCSHMLSAIGFHFRACRNNFMRLARLKPHELPSDYIEQVRMHSESILKITGYKNGIGTQFLEAQKSGVIQLRTELSKIREMIDFSKDGVITTNWDGLLQNAKLVENLIQLHGHCENADSMVLPTEMVCDDPLIAEDSRLYGLIYEATKWCDVPSEDLIRAFSRGESREILEHNHLCAENWRRSAEEVVVWGMAFNDYDAELSAVTRQIVSDKGISTSELEKVTVINLKHLEEQQRKLVGFILNFPSSKIEYVAACES